MSDESWTVLARRGEYSARAAAYTDYPMDWAVEGLVPASGATILFGTGGTGKTQLLLWLAAHIASQGPNKPDRWLGADVRVTGHVLVLSAEDLREHLFERIGGIARWMKGQTGWTDEDVNDVCSRIHVMPFLSMEPEEFKFLNPSLFEWSMDGDWRPTPSLTHIEEFLDDWNTRADVEGRPEDRFVGVILDSAVSMSGFEMANTEATTNFLFHLNRSSRRQGMFWAIIGHTPKDAGRKIDDPAVERLRGSAMWSTTPRTVIELRCAGASDKVEQVLERHPGLSAQDVLFFSTAKANSLGADLQPRVLIRVIEGGGFIDVTSQFPSIFERVVRAVRDPDRQEISPPVNEDETWRAIIEVVALAASGGHPGTKTSRRAIRDEFERQQPHNDALRFVNPEHNGKHSRSDYCLAWYLSEMRDFGALKDGKSSQLVIVDLKLIRARFREEDAGSEPRAAAGEDIQRAPKVGLDQDQDV